MAKRKPRKAAAPESKRTRTPQETAKLLRQLACRMHAHADVLSEICDDLDACDMPTITVYTGNAFSALETIRDWMELQLANKLRPTEHAVRLEVQGRLLQRLQNLIVTSDEVEEKCGGRN